MSFITDVLQPIIEGIVTFSLIGGTIFLCYRVIYDNYPKIKAKFNHFILKKPFLESDIEWCYNCHIKGYSWAKINAEMLKKGNSRYKIAEMSLIYDEMKGGLKNGK